MKFRQRYGCVLLAALLLFSLLSPLAYAAQDSDTLRIGSAEELLAFSKNCALDRWSRGKTIYLTGDINLSGLDFSPIPSFSGHFDGQGYSIYGLELHTRGSQQGLFRYLQKGAVVRSLTVRGTVSPEGSAEAVGGFVGSNAGTLLDCHFFGAVKGKISVGGLVGLNKESGQIVGGSAAGSVVGERATGGICGRNQGSVLSCTSDAAVNTADPDRTLPLENLDLSATLDGTVSPQTGEEEADKAFRDHTDSGGIVGRSSGLVQGCHNTGSVGYPHVGYNVGGVIGRQNGFVQSCSNQGFVQGRKDVGGLCGQAEPNIILKAENNQLEELQSELDRLQAYIDQALTHTDASNASVSARLSGIGDCAADARDSSKILLDSVGDFADGNIESLNALTASLHQLLDDLSPAFDRLSTASDVFHRLSDECSVALDSLSKGADGAAIFFDEAKASAEALRPVGDAVAQAAEDLRRASDELGKALVIQEEAALATALNNLSRASTDLGTALRQAGDALQSLRDAIAGSGLPVDVLENLSQLGAAFQSMGNAIARLGNALAAINANLSLDWQQLRSALSNVSLALGEIQQSAEGMDLVLVHLRDALSSGQDLSDNLNEACKQLQTVSKSASEIGSLLSEAFDTTSKALDRLTKEEPTSFYVLGERYESAGNALYGSFVTLSDELHALNEDVSQAGETLRADLRTISHQMQSVFQHMLACISETREDVEDFDLANYIEDSSDEDIAATRLGKLADSWNAGTVEADRNVGGLVGAMGIEHSLDPEDDVLPQVSLYKTYQSKAVLQTGKNYGTVTAKKDCVGGLVGRMDLGTVIYGQNYGYISSRDGDWVGGIAGFSSSSIRASYAKCSLSGGDRIGGIAGEGTSIRDCGSIVTLLAGGECLGAIAGAGDVQTGRITKNHYSEGELAAVDGVSYAGCAEEVPFSWFQEQAKVPTEFLSFLLTLRTQDGILAQIPFRYGDQPASLQLPSPPEQEGFYGAWPTLQPEDLSNNLTLEALYTPWITVLESEEQNGARALALAEGLFREDDSLHVTNSRIAPPKLKEGLHCVVWDLTLISRDAGNATPLRLLDTSGKATLQRYENGTWVKAESKRNGNYLLCKMEGDSASYCLVSDPQQRSPLPFLLAAAALLLLVILAVRKWKAKQKLSKEE